MTRAGVLLLALVLGACTVGPNYVRPEMDLPKDFGVPQPDAATNARWWTLFGDPILDQLVTEALAANRDVRAAAQRVEQARAQYGITRADQVPAVGIEGERSRTRASERAGGFQLPPDAIETNTNRLVVRASWELDFWGKYRRASEAALAELFAADSSSDAVRASLVAEVVRTYFAVRTLDRRLELIGRTLEGRRKALELQQLRFEAGAVSEFELRQVESDMRTTESLVPLARLERTRQEGALSILLGRSPREILTGVAPSGTGSNTIDRGTASVPLVVDIPEGLPSDLLLRRPDLRVAEARLHAANARIGVARAAYFPSIKLTGFFGGESQDLGDLFSGPARTWNFAAGFLQPLFAGSQIRGGVELAEARAREAVELYQKAVAVAFREARDAIAAQTDAREAMVAQQARARALERTLELAKLRYDNGATSLFEVLETERQLTLARLDAIDAERARAAAIADLYLALGI